MMHSDLASLPCAMAGAIRPLYQAPTRGLYARYLQQMVHYTRFAGAELESAGEVAKDAALAQLLSGLGREEESHYRLAESDLHTLQVPIDGTPSAEVLAYRAFWSGIDEAHAWQYAGALYVLENVARYAGPEALVALAPLQLLPRESRFVRAHLVADDDHGDRVSACCKHGFAAHALDILHGAQAASELWTAIHLAALRT
jgi:hypothetical protein